VAARLALPVVVVRVVPPVRRVLPVVVAARAQRVPLAQPVRRAQRVPLVRQAQRVPLAQPVRQARRVPATPEPDESGSPSVGFGPAPVPIGRERVSRGEPALFSSRANGRGNEECRQARPLA
jgi:hypothetical protein